MKGGRKITILRKVLALVLLTIPATAAAFGGTPVEARKEHVSKLKQLYGFESIGENHPLYAGFVLKPGDVVGKLKVERMRSRPYAGVEYLLRPTERTGGENCRLSVRTFPAIAEAEDRAVAALSSWTITASVGSLYGEKIGDHTFNDGAGSIVLHRKNIVLAVHGVSVGKADVEELAKKLVAMLDKLPQVPRDKGIKQPTITKFAALGTSAKVGEPLKIEVDVQWDGQYYVDFLTEGKVTRKDGKFFFVAEKPGIYEVTCVVTTATGLVVESEKTQVCVIKVVE